MALILLLATIGQMSTPDAVSVRNDLEFSRSVEEWVLAVEPRPTPPSPYKGLIDRLGTSCYSCREDASRRLTAALKASPADQRWLFWGRRHRDPEVRLRCNTILRRLNPCPTCNGTGNSKNWDAWPCWDCAGAATAWSWSPWD